MASLTARSVSIGARTDSRSGSRMKRISPPTLRRDVCRSEIRRFDEQVLDYGNRTLNSEDKPGTHGCIIHGTSSQRYEVALLDRRHRSGYCGKNGLLLSARSDGPQAQNGRVNCTAVRLQVYGLAMPKPLIANMVS